MKNLIFIFLFAIIAKFAFSQNSPKVKFGEFESTRTGTSLFTYKLINKNNIAGAQMYFSTKTWGLGVTKNSNDTAVGMQFLNTATNHELAFRLDEHYLQLRYRFSDSTVNDIKINSDSMSFRMGSNAWLVQDMNCQTRLKCNVLFEQDISLPNIKTSTGKLYGIVLDGDTLKKQLLSSTGGSNDTFPNGIWLAQDKAINYSNDTMYNIRIGKGALLNNNKGKYNIAIGYNAGYSQDNDTAVANIFIGREAGYSHKKNQWIGSSTAFQSGCIYIGDGAGYSDSSSTMAVMIGRNAGRNNPTPNRAIMIGNEAGLNSIGDNIIALGDWAGRDSRTGIVAIGTMAGRDQTTGEYNTFLGHGCANSLTTGSYNTGIGFGCMLPNTTNSNTHIGAYCGANTSAGTGYQNTYMGSYTGYQAKGFQNTLIGYEAGSLSTDGNQNTYIGVFSGQNNTSGSRNVFIGYQSGQNETGSDKLYISNSNTTTPLIKGDFSTGIVTFNSVLLLTPSVDPPSTAVEGQIYVDTDHHIYYYNGTAWKQLDN